MIKYTQKQLKQMIASGIAEDITRVHIDGYNELLKKEGYFIEIGYCVGVYGCNGKLLKGNNTNTLYAITARTSAIFIF